MGILIKNAVVIDPAAKLHAKKDVLIEGTVIKKIDKNIPAEKHTAIDVEGKILTPGFIDLHVHLRQPGMEDAETIASGTRAAARGGFTAVCCMPNTRPPIDNGAMVAYVRSEARRNGCIKVYPVGAITKGQEGKELTEISELCEMGCVAISDDGHGVGDAQIMRRALEYAKLVDVVITAHCEDKNLSCNGVMHEGAVSTRLGLRGIPSLAESSMVARDIALAELTSSKIHIAHVSTAESVRFMREAKARGVHVTAETCPHYFTLIDEAVGTYDTNFKMNPPLRSAADRDEIIKGLKDGTIDAIATDHAPHPQYEKERDFEHAPFGIIGSETAFALGMKMLVEPGHLTLDELIAKLTIHPAKCFGIDGGSLREGAPADITVIDPDKKWTFTEETILSRSKNSPFLDQSFTGQVVMVMCDGKIIYDWNE